MSDPVVVGLLGGVACGKSAVAAAFERRGFLVLDADRIAREVVADPAVLAAIVDRFGQGVLDADGRLDRPALAAVAFADPEATAALNALVHPEVRRRLGAELAGNRDAPSPRPVVLDVPLLLESPLADEVTTWVFISCPIEERERRARARGWPPGERERRESLQVPIETKRARADHVLENDATIGDLERRIDRLVPRLAPNPAPDDREIRPPQSPP